VTLQACAEIVQRGDRDRFLATMAAGPDLRTRLFPLFAFNVEISRAPWVTQEPMIAEMRLQWWRDALAEIGQGASVRTHEVVQPLATVIDAQGADILDKSAQARRWDIYRDPFEDAAHFQEYLDQTAGGLMWSAARALGAEGCEKQARSIGYAQGLANWFVAIPDLESRGRRPLVDGRTDAVQALARQGLSRYSQALANSPAAAVPAFRTAWLTPYLLRQVVNDPGCVQAGRLAVSEFRRRGSLLWRTLMRRA